MATDVEICQMALDHIGAKQINTLTDACQEARACRRLYPAARDQVLRDFPWDFAERRRALTLLTIPNLYGYDYCYQYPPDCHQVREIYRSPLSLPPIEYKVAYPDDVTGKVILTNQDAAVLIYTFKVTNPALFDAGFTVALSWRLASDLAMPLTKSLKMQEAMLQIYMHNIAAAGRADALEGHADPVNHFNTFVEARY
jgi:hypothetical protein